MCVGAVPQGTGVTPARASGVAALVTSGFEEVAVLVTVEGDRVDLTQEFLHLVKAWFGFARM